MKSDEGFARYMTAARRIRLLTLAGYVTLAGGFLIDGRYSLIHDGIMVPSFIHHMTPVAGTYSLLIFMLLSFATNSASIRLYLKYGVSEFAVGFPALLLNVGLAAVTLLFVIVFPFMARAKFY
jgi:hypothetical protein